MLAAQNIDFFGLGQTTVMSNGSWMTAPVIPENVPLKCSFDPQVQSWRCGYESWWREPSIYTIGVVGIAAFSIGFILALSKPLQRAVQAAKEAVPL